MHRPLSESALRAQGIRACASCGRPLWQANAKKRFCSDRCRQADHRKGYGKAGMTRHGRPLITLVTCHDSQKIHPQFQPAARPILPVEG